MSTPTDSTAASKGASTISTGKVQVVEPEIPILQKRKEEKKGSGTPLIGGGGSGAGEIAANAIGRGSMVGTSGGPWGFLGSTRFAQLLSQAFGGPSTWLGALFAGRFGGAVALGIIMTWAGLMVAVGAAVFGNFAPEQKQAQGPVFDSVAPSGIVVRKPNDNYLNGLSNVNQGEIAFETPAAPAQKEQPAPPQPQTKTAEQKIEMPTAPQVMQQLQQGALKKMDFGRGGGNTMGGQLMNALGSQVPKFGGQTNVGNGFGKNGKSTKLKPSTKVAATPRSVTRGSSNRAMGQLKLARRMSTSGAGTAGNEASRTYAADAFDQSKTLGGVLGGAVGAEAVVPPGGDGIAAPTGPGMNVTPYQDKIDDAQNKGNQAAQNKNMGMMLMALGAILMMIGMMMMSNPATMPIGMMMMMMGIMMLIMGAMMMNQGQQQAQQGKNNAKQVGNQDGQKQQQQIIENCMDQANQGVKVADCAPPPLKVQQTTVHQDVEKERGATYHF
ncbi:MAG: hypothetical protein HY078_05280 [Elusimicrobia bacterium]|nr:hypothetical protein [Elusimicrobiota bacterium]